MDRGGRIRFSQGQGGILGMREGKTDSARETPRSSRGSSGVGNGDATERRVPLAVTLCSDVFKNARGKFDGRLFFGLVMGLGSAAGMCVKLWWSIGDNVGPFWLWAGLGAIALFWMSAWLARRKEQRSLRDRLDRSGRVEREMQRERGGQNINGIDSSRKFDRLDSCPNGGDS